MKTYYNAIKGVEKPV